MLILAHIPTSRGLLRVYRGSQPRGLGGGLSAPFLYTQGSVALGRAEATVRNNQGTNTNRVRRAAAVRAVRRAAQRTDAGESALAALSSSGSLREIATAMRVRGARGVVASLSPGFLYLGENRPRYSEVPPMPE